MTRLIDADALDMYESLKSYYGDAWRDAQKEIDEAPTVDAIPIEWMREWHDSPVTETSKEICDACEGDIIEWMIAEWTIEDKT